MTPLALKTATLRKLGVISPGMPVSSDDMDVVTEKYAGLHAALIQRNTVTWALTEDIPSEAEQPVIDLLAARLVDDFGTSEPRASIIRALGALFADPMSPAERQLRSAINEDYVHSPLETDYY